MSSIHRNQVSENQLKILRVLIKHRFITVELLGKLISRSKSTVHERLVILEDQGYIHRRYMKSWRKLGRPAIYTLTGKGLRCVQGALPGYYNDALIKNQYKNKTASLHLIDHHFEITKIALLLASQYEKYTIATKYQIHKFKDFIRPLPDLFIDSNLIRGDGKQIHYLLEFIEAETLSWILKKRIIAHQEWSERLTESDIYTSDVKEDEVWGFENNYPSLLFVCQNKSTERRIQRLNNAWLFDSDILTTTQERLATGKKEIWLKEWDDFEMEYQALAQLDA